MDICLIERHLLDRLMKDPSCCKSRAIQFKCLVSGIREIELSLGVKAKSVIGEMITERGCKKSSSCKGSLTGHIIQ